MSLPVSLSIVLKPLSYKISRCLILLLMSNILSLAPLSLSTPTLSPHTHTLSLIQHTLTHARATPNINFLCFKNTHTQPPVGVSYTHLCILIVWPPWMFFNCNIEGLPPLNHIREAAARVSCSLEGHFTSPIG